MPLANKPKKRSVPPRPGDVLLESYLKPSGITQLALATRMGVPLQRVNGVVAGRRAITAQTAILLARALGTTPELWMHLQAATDLWVELQRMKRRPSVRGRRKPSEDGDDTLVR